MERYEIQIVGHIDARRARSLGGQVVGLQESGRSLLSFDAADQAALHGLLARLRDLGLELVALRRVGASAPDWPGRT